MLYGFLINNGNINNGDYITSSVIQGYGCKQTSNTLHNYALNVVVVLIGIMLIHTSIIMIKNIKFIYQPKISLWIIFIYFSFNILLI